MGLEAATFVADLVETNPLGSDQKSQGDDHIRLIKNALKATFPNANRALYAPDAQIKTSNFSIASTDQRKTFVVDTTGGSVSATLPTLLLADAGWSCSFLKISVNANALFVFPPSGTITSGEVAGLTHCRRCVPGHTTHAFWSGSGWFMTRISGAPLGTVFDWVNGNTLPAGYEWPNGQTFSAGASAYPEYFLTRGNGQTPDLRGRVVAGKDDMGLGGAASRLTGAGSGITGTALWSAGGTETHLLLKGQLPAHGHVGTTDAEIATHFHTSSFLTADLPTGADSGVDVLRASGGGSFTLTTSFASNQSTNHTHTFTSQESVIGGSGNVHQNTQPTIILNKLLLVE